MSLPSPVISIESKNAMSQAEVMAAIKNDQLLLINNISLEEATGFLTELADGLQLSVDNNHHFNNLGNPFRRLINDAFIEVSESGGRSIFFHNENPYSRNPPEMTYFYCKTNSEFGGEHIFLHNDKIIKSRGAQVLYSEMYMKIISIFPPGDIVKDIMKTHPNFAKRNITDVQGYVDHLKQFNEFISVNLSNERLELVVPVNLYRESCLNGKSYLMIPSDGGSCSVTYHVREFCEKMGVFYNPMFEYIKGVGDDAISTFEDTGFFFDKECTSKVDLNQIIFEMLLVTAYTNGVPVKLTDNSLIVFNNKSWMHSVNAPGSGREVYVGYAYR